MGQPIRESIGGDRRRLAAGEHRIHGTSRDEVVSRPHPVRFHLAGAHPQQQASQRHATEGGGFRGRVELGGGLRRGDGRFWRHCEGLHDGATVRRRDSTVAV